MSDNSALKQCPVCNGTGKNLADKGHVCPSCGGSGRGDDW